MSDSYAYNIQEEAQGKKVKITSKTKSNAQKTVPFHRLYRFCTGEDLFLLFLATTMSLAIGVSGPINMMVFRNVVNTLVSDTKPKSYFEELKQSILFFVIIAASTFAAGFISYTCSTTLSERIGRRLKCAYFTALMRQEIEWFDKQQTGQLVTSLTDDIETIETATTDKLIQIIQQLANFSAAIIVAFVNDWRLSLFSMIMLPMICLIFFFLFRFVKKFAILQIKSYSLAGGIAEEILSGLRTVVAFNAQKTEVKRYVENLKTAEQYGIKRAVCQGLASGSIGLSVWGVGALVFYMGLRYLEDGTTTGGQIILVFFTVVLGSIALGNTIPNLDSILQAQVAGYNLFQVIDRVPKIDFQKTGKILDEFSGDIEFKNVNFHYPTRPNVPILKNFNFTIKKGQTVAFIGPSGSGKSTVVHLLQRFYDPESGSVNLNGTDLRELDLNWFRSNIGVVQQEPKLFNGTVEENIKLGKLNASYDEVVEATKRSNAYDFIMKTREKFDTELGDLGAGFSGGQKQRLAIACALIRKPSLLLLDEATSALDNVSERIVQKTIDREIQKQDGVKKTVVMVAHRLQTVRNADVIVVMRNGEIIEQGNHAELMKVKGLYWRMLTAQLGDQAEEEEESIEKLEEMEEAVDMEEERKRSLNERKFSRTLSIKEELIMVKKLSRIQTLKDCWLLMKLNHPERKFIILGVIISFVIGIMFPCGSLLLSQLYQVFAYVKTDLDKYHQIGNLFCGLLLIPAFVLFFGQIFKNGCFGYSGEALTTRLREKMFSSILNQEMEWFDEPLNQPGSLTGRLALEASLVKGAAGIQIGIFIEAAANLLTAIIIGFIFSWQLALLFFIFVPLITMSGVMQGRNMSSGSATMDLDAVDGKSTITLALETLNNIRSVQSLGLQQYLQNKFESFFEKSSKQKIFKTFLYGLFGGIGVSAMFWSYTVIFYVGSILLDQNKLKFINLLRVFSCLNMSSASLGRALALSPDVDKARKAARKSLNTIFRQSNIDPSSEKGIIPKSKFEGTIEFNNVHFYYPSRPNIQVLRGLSLKIEDGETIALVGHSGCGKSTLIQLLERFYDPCLRPGYGYSRQTTRNMSVESSASLSYSNAAYIADSVPNVSTNQASSYNDSSASCGQVLIDGYDIKTLNVAWLRSQIGLVSQEPTLFNMSVRENITLGIMDSNQIDEDKIIKAAQMANIHEFVKSLPQGYDTKVGQRGGHLSGGQRQRICIARALYREPKILLLDEATSALDQESESIVQAAVETAQQTCTSLSIAHRLSTVRNSDRIAVLETGRVMEVGSHEDLVKYYPNGLYAQLLKASTEGGH